MVMLDAVPALAEKVVTSTTSLRVTRPRGLLLAGLSLDRRHDTVFAFATASSERLLHAATTLRPPVWGWKSWSLWSYGPTWNLWKARQRIPTAIDGRRCRHEVVGEPDGGASRGNENAFSLA